MSKKLYIFVYITLYLNKSRLYCLHVTAYESESESESRHQCYYGVCLHMKYTMYKVHTKLFCTQIKSY